MNKEYNTQSLIEKSRLGDQEAFNALLQPVIYYRKSLVRRFFLPGSDSEDLEQEAMVGFAQALRDYQPGHQLAFKDYAMLCMRNAVVASVRKATRKKHQMLSDASTLDPRQAVASQAYQPDRVVTSRCFLEALFKRLKTTLSSLELSALVQRTQGISIRDIAEEFSLGEKTVENALFRARKKAKLATVAIL